MREKYIRISVNTEKGQRSLTFRPVDVTNATDLICESDCPYKGVCDKIKDPRKDAEEGLTFLDFCSEIGTEEDGSIDENRINCVPIEGTLETELGDIVSIWGDLIDKNPYVKLSDVIDGVCPGWCDAYTPDHVNCKAGNGSCILRALYLKKKK